MILEHALKYDEAILHYHCQFQDQVFAPDSGQWGLETVSPRLTGGTFDASNLFDPAPHRQLANHILQRLDSAAGLYEECLTLSAIRGILTSKFIDAFQDTR
jgi:hypothetical protein